MTASSHYKKEEHSAKYGRLFNESGYGWFPKNNKKTDWLQVDLGKEYQVCAVATQGGNYDKKYKEWTTAFKLLYSSDDKNRKTYKDGNGVDVVSWIIIWSVWVSKVIRLPLPLWLLWKIRSTATSIKMQNCNQSGFDRTYLFLD